MRPPGADPLRRRHGGDGDFDGDAELLSLLRPEVYTSDPCRLLSEFCRERVNLLAMRWMSGSGALPEPSKLPTSLKLEEFWQPPAGCVSGDCITQSYAVSDVFYVEACLISRVCTNRDQLFKLGVGQDFVCELDRKAYGRLPAIAARS